MYCRRTDRERVGGSPIGFMHGIEFDCNLFSGREEQYCWAVKHSPPILDTNW